MLRSHKLVALEVKEKKLDLSSDSNGITYSGTLNIRNKISTDVALKIKSNFPQYYSVKPTSIILQPNNSLQLSIKMHSNALKSNISSHKIQILAYCFDESDRQRSLDQSAIDGFFKGEYLTRCQKKMLDINLNQFDKLEITQIQEVNEANEDALKQSGLRQQQQTYQSDRNQDNDNENFETLQTDTSSTIQLPTRNDMNYKYNNLKQRLEEQYAIQVKQNTIHYIEDNIYKYNKDKNRKRNLIL